MPNAVRETTPMMRLGGTAVLFAVALGLFVVAAVTHRAWPLFVAWAPLVAVPWLLTRTEAGEDHGRESVGGDPMPGATERMDDDAQRTDDGAEHTDVADASDATESRTREPD